MEVLGDEIGIEVSEGSTVGFGGAVDSGAEMKHREGHYRCKTYNDLPATNCARTGLNVSPTWKGMLNDSGRRRYVELKLRTFTSR